MNQSGEIDDDLLTIKETMKRLRIGRSTFYTLKRTGKIKTRKFGHRTVRVTKESVDILLKEQ